MKYFFCLGVLLGFECVQALSLTPYMSKGNFVRIFAPYTLGTHKGVASTIFGQVEIDPVKKNILSATLSVPLVSVDMGKDAMTCHFKESLGLNYAGSNFPKEHVCDSKNRLPSEGKNAMAFPDISFRFKSALALADKDQGLWKANEVVGDWTLHGVTKELKSVMWILEEEGGYKVKGDQTFALKDFGIIVKPFLVIKVKDHVRADFEISLRN